jgi:putative tRNA adenosine deaminase-associated protein
VPYFAVALARTEQGWSGEEVDLDDVDDLEVLAEQLRDLLDDGPGPALLLLDPDDEYVGVVRVDGGGSLLVEPRVFLSDRRAVHTAGVAALLWEEDGDAEDDEEDEGTRPVAEPVGDAALLADLGTPADDLVALCAEEGLLPADVHTALCERAGCLDVLESLREG